MSPHTRPVPNAPLVEVDARGLRCPLPVIRLAQAARDAAAGTVIVVLAGDPAARHDIPAWCRMRDHELLDLAEVREVTGTTGATDPPASDAEGAAGAASDAEGAAGAGPAYLRFVVLIRHT